MSFTFEWDEEKAAANLTKHGVSFSEASTVLLIRYHEQFATLYIPKTRNDSLFSANQACTIP